MPGIVFLFILMIVFGSLGGLITYWDDSTETLKAGWFAHIFVGIAGAIVLVALFVYIFHFELAVFDRGLDINYLTISLLPEVLFVSAISIVGGYSSITLISLLGKATLDEISKRLEEQQKETALLSVEVKYNKALVSAEFGDYSVSLDWFEQVLQEIPNHVNAWFYKAYVLKRLGRIEEAVDAALKAAELDSAEWLHWYNLACYKHLSGVEIGETIQILDRVKQLTSDSDREKFIRFLKLDLELDGDFVSLSEQREFREFLDSLS